MCMAPNQKDEKIIMKTFIKTRQIYDRINLDELPLTILSMGMSNDYKIAIKEGSNMIRIGRLIFK